MFKNFIFYIRSWLMMLITIYAIVSSCDDCLRKSGKKSFRNPPAPLAAVTPAPPKDKNLSNLSAPTDSLGSTPSPTPAAPPSSGASGSSSSSGSDSGYDSSSSSSGFSGPSSPSLPTPFAGLPNLGNTCYMNAVLQIIAALYADKVPEGYLKTLIGKINTGSKPLADSDITEFIKGLPAGAKDMATLNNQEDPYEFITLLADKINFLYPIQCTEHFFFKKAADSQNIYSIQQQSTFISLLPGILPIPILPDVLKLTEMIQLYQNGFVEEGTDLDNINLDICTTTCETLPPYVEVYKDRLTPVQTGFKKNYIKYTVFDKLPEKLCIQLARFDCKDNNKNNNKNKISKLISEALTIKIQPNPNQEPFVSFDLDGFIVHRGDGTASGHYIAYVKRERKWYEANDSTIQEIPLSEATDKSKTAYLLFYKKE